MFCTMLSSMETSRLLDARPFFWVDVIGLFLKRALRMKMDCRFFHFLLLQQRVAIFAVVFLPQRPETSCGIISSSNAINNEPFWSRYVNYFLIFFPFTSLISMMTIQNLGSANCLLPVEYIPTLLTSAFLSLHSRERQPKLFSFMICRGLW